MCIAGSSLECGHMRGVVTVGLGSPRSLGNSEAKETQDGGMQGTLDGEGGLAEVSYGELQSGVTGEGAES